MVKVNVQDMMENMFLKGGFEISELAKKVSISEETLEGFFNGEETPTIDTFRDICIALEVSPFAAVEEACDPQYSHAQQFLCDFEMLDGEAKDFIINFVEELFSTTHDDYFGESMPINEKSLPEFNADILGARLKRARRALGMPLECAAEFSGITKEELRDIEDGECFPTLQQLLDFAFYYSENDEVLDDLLCVENLELASGLNPKIAKLERLCAGLDYVGDAMLARVMDRELTRKPA